MFLCAQAFFLSHRLHSALEFLLLGFLLHISLIDFSFACIRNICGVTAGGGSRNRPFHPTKDNNAPTMSRSIIIVLPAQQTQFHALK
jgi:hypothetical protein